MEVHVVTLVFKETRIIQGVYDSEEKATAAIKNVFEQQLKLQNETVEEVTEKATTGDEFDVLYEGYILDKELASELMYASTETFTVN